MALQALLEARVELRPLLLNSHERLKDLIFLDIALDSTVRTAVERAYEELNNAESEVFLIPLHFNADSGIYFSVVCLTFYLR